MEDERERPGGWHNQNAIGKIAEKADAFVSVRLKEDGVREPTNRMGENRARTSTCIPDVAIAK
jgi:hypothetical protein